MSIFGSLMAKIMGHEARKHEETVNAAVAENAPAASTARGSQIPLRAASSNAIRKMYIQFTMAT